jgi:hypothetical protein
VEDETDPSEQLVEATKAKQRNVDWRDAHMNGRTVDEFLWKGSPDASLVQRIGACLFGIAFVLVGIGLVEVDRETGPDRKSR